MTSQTPVSVLEPDGPVRGGIVVVQEAFGVNDHIEDVARRFAAEGWLAVAPHLFHRTGGPTFGYDDISVVMPHMQALTAEGEVGAGRLGPDPGLVHRAPEVTRGRP